MSRSWTVTIPAPVGLNRAGKRTTLWLNTNDRMHWSRRSQLTKAWRLAGRAAATKAAIPPLDRAHVTATFHKTRAGRWDPANLYPTVKAAIDGALVDTNILEDDDADHLTGPDMRAGEPRDTPCLVLTITDLGDTAP